MGEGSSGRGRSGATLAAMSQTLFLQNIIAVIWDFDKTLIPGYMQEPLFRRYGVESAEFWQEVNSLGAYYRNAGIERVADDMIYLNHLLTYVTHGVFQGLSNAVLRELGREIEFYPGMPDFLSRTKRMVASDPTYQKHEIALEHYVVSTGLRQMIMGSRIAEFVDDVWACEFLEHIAPPGYLAETPPLPGSGREIRQIGYSIDNTTKTRALFEINKGTNRFPRIGVNSKIDEAERRIPFQNMIYVADGPSDVPVFSILNQKGGRTFAVYRKGSHREFQQVNELQKQDRVRSFGEANYTEDSQTSMWIETAIREIADRIVAVRDQALGDKVGKAPRHLSDEE